jgi:hypothetical protein
MTAVMLAVPIIFRIGQHKPNWRLLTGGIHQRVRNRIIAVPPYSRYDNTAANVHGAHPPMRGVYKMREEVNRAK